MGLPRGPGEGQGPGHVGPVQGDRLPEDRGEVRGGRMRIIKLSAENIKKLKAVEISPGGAVVEITGPNGSGKSSVLDAIFYALAGTADIPSAVVRKGSDRAHVR